MYSAQLIADYVIASGGGMLTPLQVIKLVYISHGYTLAVCDRPLVPDKVEAWRYGPVIPSIYNTLKKYGGDPVPSSVYCGTMAGTDATEKQKEFLTSIIPYKAKAVLDRVLKMYGKLTGIELMKLTHKKGSPWSTYYKKGVRRIVIPNRAIKKHYEELLSSDNSG